MGGKEFLLVILVGLVLVVLAAAASVLPERRVPRAGKELDLLLGHPETISC